MEFRKLEELVELNRNRAARKLVVAAAQDRQVLLAVKNASDSQLVEPVFIGNGKKIRSYCEDIGFAVSDDDIIDEPDPAICCTKAVDLIRDGKAEILMKGMVPTAHLLKAVLDKENGLSKRDLLSHFALIEIPAYNRLLGITDAGMNIMPGLEEKVSIIRNAVDVYHSLGCCNPKVAVLAPVEVVNPKIESTLDADALRTMNERNQLEGCTVDGPLALDIAISPDAAHHKGIKGDVAGKADVLLAPDLNSGNILYKALIFLSMGTAASVIMGASVPIVLTSRADSEKSKFMSIALAAAMNG